MPCTQLAPLAWCLSSACTTHWRARPSMLKGLESCSDTPDQQQHPGPNHPAVMHMHLTACCCCSIVLCVPPAGLCLRRVLTT